jgi:hypothetical protein
VPELTDQIARDIGAAEEYFARVVVDDRGSP